MNREFLYDLLSTGSVSGNEAAIEKVLLDNGLLYDKSEDVFIEDEGVFVIYYTV